MILKIKKKDTQSYNWTEIDRRIINAWENENELNCTPNQTKNGNRYKASPCIYWTILTVKFTLQIYCYFVINLDTTSQYGQSQSEKRGKTSQLLLPLHQSTYPRGHFTTWLFTGGYRLMKHAAWRINLMVKIVQLIHGPTFWTCYNVTTTTKTFDVEHGSVLFFLLTKKTSKHR